MDQSLEIQNERREAASLKHTLQQLQSQPDGTNVH